MARVKTHGKGRVSHSSAGHKQETFRNVDLMQFYPDGIQFALGDPDLDTTPDARLKPRPQAALVE